VAAEQGLNVIFISRQPENLREEDYEIIANSAQKTRQEIENWIQGQKQRCENLADRISSIEWTEDWQKQYGYEYKDLPRKIVEKEAGVVIPTVRWGAESQPHSLVIKEFRDKRVFFNNPNMEKRTDMNEDEFYRLWIDTATTDNDLLIISRDKIDLHNI